MAERSYFCRVPVALGAAMAARGDGSPLEEGSSGVIYTLDEALELCCSGQITDAKTEIALRRLADYLSTAPHK